MTMRTGKSRLGFFVGATIVALVGTLWLAPAAAGGCGSHGAKAEAKGCGGGGGNGHGCCGACGGGKGRGAGKRAGKGASHHDSIHSLLDHHEAIQREVKQIDSGVETVTTSEDPQVTQTIREHVRQMQQRMESGQGMRWWDPLFAELFEHHEKVRMEIEDVPGGVLVRETSDDPKVVSLIRQHAVHAVSEFVERGYDRAHQPSSLPDGYDEAVDTANAEKPEVGTP